MGQGSVQLKARCRSVSVGRRSTVLQERSWQVLSTLVARAPEVVSRADLIDELWQGNYLTGEKGLNQAVWTIRSALDDDTKEPRFIRTVPRVGYQWIHSGISIRENAPSRPMRTTVMKAAGVAALFVIPMIAIYLSESAPGMNVESHTMPPDMIATRAYLVDRDIHVEFENGCLGILKNENYAEIGTPVLSLDGARIAVTLRKNESCRLVTIDVSNGERQDFDTCPSDVI